MIGPNDALVFGPGRPFHAMVLAYTTALVGVGIIWDTTVVLPYEDDHQFKFLNGKVRDAGGGLFPMERVNEARRGENSAGMEPTVNALTSMLLNSAYEAVRKHSDKGPVFEFLRHLRNAASHGQKFNFRDPNHKGKGGEPSRPAVWRGITIDHNLQGRQNPIYGTSFWALLEPVDILLLLYDIEETLIAAGH